MSGKKRFKLTLVSSSIGGKHVSAFVNLPMESEEQRGPLDTTGRPAIGYEMVHALLHPTAGRGRTVSFG